MYKSNKIVLIGAGNVGCSFAYSLIISNFDLDELVVIDINKNKAIGEILDLNHTQEFLNKNIKIQSSEDYSTCKDASIIVITVEASKITPNKSRLELLDNNLFILKNIIKNIMESGFNGILLIASNPVDIISYAAYKYSGLPSNKVIGSGTILDTMRLRYFLSQYFNINTNNIHSYVLGEHGDNSFVTWNQTFIGIKKLQEFIFENKITKNDLSTIEKRVISAAWDIINLKGNTAYGIGMSLTKIVNCILTNQNTILPLSSYLNGEFYDIKNIYIGVPSVINRDGIREIISCELGSEELDKFIASASYLSEYVKKI